MGTIKLMSPLVAIFLFGNLFNLHSAALTEPENDATILLENLIPKNYTKAIRPNFGGDPITVNISMYIINFYEISETTMDYRISIYFRQRWTDHRLAFPVRGGLKDIVIGESLSKKIWFPDTFFANIKSIQAIDTASGREGQFTKVSSNGQVYMSRMLDIIASCPMNLQYFPFDSQFCTLEMESYASSMTDIKYQWDRPDAVGITIGIGTPNIWVRSVAQKERVEKLSSGAYSRLVAEIFLDRGSRGYIYRFYLPAFLLVLLSWFPLFLTPAHPYARLGLLSVAFLVSLGTFALQFSTRVPVGYLTAIDWYLLISMLTILIALIINAVVAYFRLGEDSTEKSSTIATLLDKWARWVLVVVYLGYNLIYIICMKNV